eukprot:9991904-Alexandrium_andersonii.AAC.1
MGWLGLSVRESRSGCCRHIDADAAAMNSRDLSVCVSQMSSHGVLAGSVIGNALPRLCFSRQWSGVRGRGRGIRGVPAPRLGELSGSA